MKPLQLTESANLDKEWSDWLDDFKKFDTACGFNLHEHKKHYNFNEERIVSKKFSTIFESEELFEQELKNQIKAKKNGEFNVTKFKLSSLNVSNIPLKPFHP